MTRPLPHRPRLADFAMLRRHWIEGIETFALHDSRAGALLLLDRSAFEVVLASDGTRDVAGVRKAASRTLGAVTEERVRAVLDALHTEQLLTDDAEEPELEQELANASERALVRLPGYLFHCSGVGHCCAQYASIPLTRDDFLRARRAGLAGGDSDHVVLPLYGSNFGGRLAMTLVNGQCLQLGGDRRCGLHLRGGAEAKPTGCAAFPATLVDDGIDVRVTPALECDCVFASRGNDAPDHVELLTGYQTLRSLPEGLAVRRLPDTIHVNDELTASPAQLSAWSREEAQLVPEESAPMHAINLARRLEKAGLASSGVVLQESSVHLALAIRDLAAHMATAAEAAAAWRSPRDRTRIVRERVRDAAAALSGDTLTATLADTSFAADEAFALRTAIFGHQLAGGAPLHRALVGFAAELIVARRLKTVAPELGHPIAAVHAAVRGG